MFGYIAPVFSVLTEEQKKRYRETYCGVCLSLKRHGQPERISLSHDMTFLALLLNSLYGSEGAPAVARCALHPLKKHPVKPSPWTDYAADMNLLLFYWKCRDSVQDDRSLSGKAGERKFRKAFGEIEKQYPMQSKAVGEALDRLWALEKEESPSPDELCNLSGKMLGSVFVPKPEDIWAPELYAVGESLGRFIYWMDAWEDLKQDLKKHRFNPLAAWKDREDYETFVQETLEMFVGEAAAHFEVLPLEEDLDLLRNVLYSGVWQRYRAIQDRREQAEAKKQRKEESR